MNKLFLLLLPLLAVVGVFLETPDTFAASPYDNTIKVTETLVLRDTTGNEEIIVNGNWRTLFNDHCGPQAIVALDNAITNGSYAVSQYDVSQYNEQEAIRVVWDTRSSTITPLPEFSGSNVTQLAVNWTGYCEIYLNTDSSIVVDVRIETGGGSGWEIAMFNGDRYILRPFLTTYEIPYPQDYEGEIIPDTWQPPVEPLDFTPKFVITKLLNYKLEVYDSVYFTFDSKPFACEDELSPIIDYKLQSITTPSFVVEGLYSPTVPLYLDLLNDGNPQEYRLTGKYRCPDMLPEFSDSSFIEFEADVNGNLYQNFIKDCFIPEFPGLDFDACMDNFRTILGFMGFRITGIQPERFVFADNDCHTLQTLHTWLNLDNNIICKQFPDYVRNVVTPFVSFAIGLMTLRFIASRRRDDL